MHPAAEVFHSFIEAFLPHLAGSNFGDLFGGELLTDAALFDVYRGAGLPEGTKSLAFALTYQSHKGTLSDNDIKKAHEKVEGRLRHMLKAQIRGKDIT